MQSFCLTTLPLRSTLRSELRGTGPDISRLVPRSFRAKHKAKWEFGLLRFRSPLLTEYLLVYFPPGTEMFYFPGCARAPRKIFNLKLSIFH